MAGRRNFDIIGIIAPRAGGVGVPAGRGTRRCLCFVAHQIVVVQIRIAGFEGIRALFAADGTGFIIHRGGNAVRFGFQILHIGVRRRKIMLGQLFAADIAEMIAIRIRMRFFISARAAIGTFLPVVIGVVRPCAIILVIAIRAVFRAAAGADLFRCAGRRAAVMRLGSAAVLLAAFCALLNHGVPVRIMIGVFHKYRRSPIIAHGTKQRVRQRASGAQDQRKYKRRKAYPQPPFHLFPSLKQVIIKYKSTWYAHSYCSME